LNDAAAVYPLPRLHAGQIPGRLAEDLPLGIGVVAAAILGGLAGGAAGAAVSLTILDRVGWAGTAIITASGTVVGMYAGFLAARLAAALLRALLAAPAPPAGNRRTLSAAGGALRRS
jgi:hypothetical protein